MKFEQLLQVYWLKGFYYDKDLISYEITPKKLFSSLPGFSNFSFDNFTRKFEASAFIKNNSNFVHFNDDEKRIVNMYFAQAASVNHIFFESSKIFSTRLYLIKSFRGRMQAIGKPSRGQRTRSNANTAYKNDNFVKMYISQFNKSHIKIEPVKRINYRIVQRKVLKKTPKYLKKTAERRINLWI